MRVTICRRVAFGFVLIPLLGVSAAAQPPILEGPPGSLPISPAKLKADSAALAAELKSAAEDSNERTRLRNELMGVLKRINEGPATGPWRPTFPPTPVTPPKTKPDPIDTSKPVDTLRLAMNLFRDNDFDAALRAFRLLDPGQLTREDRAFVRYMTGCCLRRMNRTAEAASIFTEVANSQEDEFVASCAVWQLSLLRSNQELEAQLEQLRARAKLR